MADFICLAMASQYTENNNNQEANSTSFRRSLGSSTLFGRRSSRSATSATTAMNTPGGTRPTSDSSIIAPENQTTHIRIVPSIENPSRSLVFSIIERDLEAGRIIKIGRFTDRSSIQNHISFKSKVVSRSHCEIWLNNEGKVQLKDTKSSSGTFVNHVRLSPANTESRPVEIRDGDLVQLGVDYQGGYEEIYRSVKMRFEVNRPNQPRPVSYSMSAFNNLRNLTSLPSPTDQPQQQQQQLTTSPLSPSLSHEQNVEVEECCICLYALAPFQALFVAPCSHSYHFKCIRPLFDSYPGFQCPICRTYSDLDASVAIEAEEVIEKFGLRKSSTSAIATSPVITATAAAAAASGNAADVVSTSDEDEQDNDVVDDERLVSSSSSVQPTNVLSCATISPAPEPPLSTTLVACTTSLSGIISSPTSSSNVPILENQVSRDFNAGDHRATIIFEDDNNVIQQQIQQQQQPQHQPAHQRSASGTAAAANNTNRQSNNLVEKIKMAFSNDKRHKSKQRTHSSGSASSDDDIMERSETFYDMPCPTSSSSSPPSSPRSTALQPILSRQSTHYNPLNGILEEGSQSAIEGGSSS